MLLKVAQKPHRKLSKVLATKWLLDYITYLILTVHARQGYSSRPASVCHAQILEITDN